MLEKACVLVGLLMLVLWTVTSCTKGSAVIGETSVVAVLLSHQGKC